MIIMHSWTYGYTHNVLRHSAGNSQLFMAQTGRNAAASALNGTKAISTITGSTKIYSTACYI